MTRLGELVTLVLQSVTDLFSLATMKPSLDSQEEGKHERLD